MFKHTDQMVVNTEENNIAARTPPECYLSLFLSQWERVGAKILRILGAFAHGVHSYHYFEKRVPVHLPILLNAHPVFKWQRANQIR